MATQNIEAPSHTITDSQIRTQERVSAANRARFIGLIRDRRNFVMHPWDTFISFLRPTRNLEQPIAVSADQANDSMIRNIELNSRQAAVREANGQNTPIERNRAFRDRLSSGVAGEFLNQVNQAQLLAVADNARRLGFPGRLYRTVLAYPEGAVLAGSSLCLTALTSGLRVNPGVFPLQINEVRDLIGVGIFITSFGALTAIKDGLVARNVRHTRDLGDGIESTVKRLSSFVEHRAVLGRNLPINLNAENLLRETARIDIQSALRDELSQRGSQLPFDVNSTIGVESTSKSIVNVLGRINFPRLWAQDMIDQRRHRAAVFLAALGITAAYFFLPGLIEQQPPTQNPNPPAAGPVLLPGLEHDSVVFKNPDYNYANHDRDISSIHGEAQALIAQDIFGMDQFNSNDPVQMKAFSAKWSENQRMYDDLARDIERFIVVENPEQTFGDEISHPRSMTPVIIKVPTKEGVRFFVASQSK